MAEKYDDGLVLDPGDVRFLAARLRRLFRRFDIPVPNSDDDASLIGNAGAGIGLLLGHADRAFKIADEAMFVDLRSYGVWRDQRCYVDEGMYAGDHVAEAVEWLLSRGFLQSSQDDQGPFVRVVREPSSTDARGAEGSKP